MHVRYHDNGFSDDASRILITSPCNYVNQFIVSSENPLGLDEGEMDHLCQVNNAR